MSRHRFDPLSAALGVVAIVAGIVVITGRLLALDDSAPLLAVGALVLGLGLVPWTSLRHASPDTPDVADVSDPVPHGRDET